MFSLLLPPLLQKTTTTPPLPPQIRKIADGFYNIRTSLKVLYGWIDIQGHMSIVRLNSGKYLVFDTIRWVVVVVVVTVTVLVLEVVDALLVYPS